jgi:hypothetical protein
VEDYDPSGHDMCADYQPGRRAPEIFKCAFTPPCAMLCAAGRRV